MVNCSSIIQLYIYIYIYDISNAFLTTTVISSQVTQQVYVAEDWVRSTTTNLNAEI